MVYLTALLPVGAGVGVFAALKAAAASAVGTGASTSTGAAMVDELVRGGTGSGDEAPPRVALRLMMSAETLFDPDGPHGTDPAVLAEHGPVPADLARALIADNLDAGVKVWIKRLLTHPHSGQLIAMDSHARLFPASWGEFLNLRDQYCRTPWCNAPIRHHDHIEPHAHGGPTTAINGQGLCEDCNHTKQAPGWKATVDPAEPRHTVITTTPTGRRYRSRAPAF
jgi:hypothetical protein